MKKPMQSYLIVALPILLLVCGSATAEIVEVFVPIETAAGDTGHVQFSYESETVAFFIQNLGPERSQAVYAAALKSFELRVNGSFVR